MKKLSIGVTGYKGFIGYHLSTHIKYIDDNLNFIACPKNYFSDKEKLESFVSKCDVIVHLAAKNRGEDDEVISNNIALVDQLISALNTCKKKIHLIFASSTQESNRNAYGKSKIEGVKKFQYWAKGTNNKFTSLKIPNVFGPFCKPYYNSVVSTFCYQLIKQKTPEIIIDNKVDFIYVQNLVKTIVHEIYNNKRLVQLINVKADKSIKVSSLLKKLLFFKESYLKLGIIPKLRNEFDVNLFNSFRSYIRIKDIKSDLVLHNDERGYLFENIKEMTGGQTFFSSTKPGITRGNHFHKNKIERFCVVSGEAIISMRKIGSRKCFNFKVSGLNPVAIDIPIFFTHNIKNIGREDLLTLFWSNEIYDSENPDTYFLKV
ncbi:MAG: epimerase [Candidatus Marinimicrobia bacterium]|nr:epimerase [Candidatus Neomarinimicrobiota bacterium]|tara:strand:+ start:1488 stop:2609 length:1122 start_codon:yes stop_codon:yes gene_type:complete